jgi:hypothetical protein
MIKTTLCFILIVSTFVSACQFGAQQDNDSAVTKKKSPEVTQSKSSKGRALSLNVLQKQLAECIDGGRCSDDILHLAGITKIIGYTIDSKNRDIIIVGRVDDSLPPLYTEDFVVALRNSWHKYAKVMNNTSIFEYPGCSIDMRPAVARQLMDFSNSLNEWHQKVSSQLNGAGMQSSAHLAELERQKKGLQEYEAGLEKYKAQLHKLDKDQQSPKGQNRLAGLSAEYKQYYAEYQNAYRNYERAFRRYEEAITNNNSLVRGYQDGDQNAQGQWCKICQQPQDVRVLGLPFDSRFGRIMVDADYHMKRLVNGSDDLHIDGFKSLTKLRENERSASNQVDMNRFWFLPGDNSYVEDKGIVLIKNSDVRLETEEEFLSNTNKIQGRGHPDPLAKEFAETFTEKYAQIAQRNPIYKELEGLFRFVSLAQLLKYKNAPTKAGLNIDYLLNGFPEKKTHVDRTLGGLSYVGKGGYTQMTCGGVSIDIGISAKNISWDSTEQLLEMKQTILATRPSIDTLFWEYALGPPHVI